MKIQKIRLQKFHRTLQLKEFFCVQVTGILFNYCLMKTTQLVKCIGSFSLIVDIIEFFPPKS